MANTQARSVGLTPLPKKSSTASAKGQKTLHGFFTRTPATVSSSATLPERPSPSKGSNSGFQAKILNSSSGNLTPVPSSDGPGLELELEDGQMKKASQPLQSKGLPSPVSSANGEGQTDGTVEVLTASGTPSRRVCTFGLFTVM